MYNKDIRRAIEQGGIRYFEVANRLGVADSYFSRMLRWELDPPTKQRILTIVEELRTEKWGGDEYE